MTPPTMSRTPATSHAGSGLNPFNSLSARIMSMCSSVFPFWTGQYQPVVSEWARAPHGD